MKLFLACDNAVDRYVVARGKDDDRVLVPAKVVNLHWSGSVLAGQVHPLKPRDLFPGDDAKVPDETTWEWYIIDLRANRVHSCKTEQEFQCQYEAVGGSIERLHWLDLRGIWRQSEAELGFEFTDRSIRDYLDFP